MVAFIAPRPQLLIYILPSAPHTPTGFIVIAFARVHNSMGSSYLLSCDLSWLCWINSATVSHH